MEDTGGYQRALFAAGCFWDVEAAFRRVTGVIATAVGYTGGSVTHPSYEQVSKGNTGHSEAVDIVFDPAVVSYPQLLGTFREMLVPTAQDYREEYSGSPYRSVIYYYDNMQKEAAYVFRECFLQSGESGDIPVVIEILPADKFWIAEECHQQFYEKCRQGYCTSRQIDE
jgi:peptide-methionine (S)-S-oxide reductase